MSLSILTSVKCLIAPRDTLTLESRDDRLFVEMEVGRVPAVDMELNDESARAIRDALTTWLEHD